MIIIKKTVRTDFFYSLSLFVLIGQRYYYVYNICSGYTVITNKTLCSAVNTSMSMWRSQ